jgi:hypothetical protein
MAMDLQEGYAGLSNNTVYIRAFAYFLWIYGVLLAGFLIGFVPSLIGSALLFIRFHGREKWSTAIAVSIGLFVFIWLVFDKLIHQSWPPSIIGSIFPVLRTIVPWF